MLQLNQPSSHLMNTTNPTNAQQQQWKLLIYDDFCRDVISPLLRLADLREQGVTVHLCVFCICLFFIIVFYYDWFSILGVWGVALTVPTCFVQNHFYRIYSLYYSFLFNVKISLTEWTGRCTGAASPSRTCRLCTFASRPPGTFSALGRHACYSCYYTYTQTFADI